MNLRIAGAILRKDVSCLLPLVALTTLFFLADSFITRLDLLPVWTAYGTAVRMVAMLVLVLSVFQLDSAASLTDDWLCRPVRVRELLVAKFTLLLLTLYLPRVVGVLAADLAQGFSPTESLLEAVLLPESLAPLLLPMSPLLLLMFVFAAIVTRTFVQAFGVLFVIFICVFALPTPFVRPPGPLTPGIREALWFSGVEWLAAIPSKLAFVVLLAVGFWLVYRRRRLFAARVLLAVSVCIALLFALLPMALLPWGSTYALQKAAGPAPGPTVPGIELRHANACFPAALRSDLLNPAFVAARRKAGVETWDDETLQQLDPDSLAFLTTVKPRGLPPDWRAKLTFVEAEYRVGGETRYSLRPARYLTDGRGGGTLSHEWMLPAAAVPQLRDEPAELRLDYSLALLEPRDYQVRVDGEREYLPGLGFCGAKLDGSGDRIHVDCFTTSHPAQVSAQLNDIPASRAYGGVDFAPAWAAWPHGMRTKLDIASPRLARHDTITVTAWRATGYVNASLTLTGILGADLSTCPLPTGDTESFQKARWSDTAAHETHSVAVDKGVQLEVLDFGGQGSPIVLLPGLGATAHAYDELGPQLANEHRVIAITRRGAGYSSKPDFGFDTPRLSQDVLAVMDQLNLRKVLLVGHSIAGEELTWLGGHHGDRFSGLVYLDAAYDRSQRHDEATSRLRELSAALPPEPPSPPDAWLNYEVTSKLLEQRGHTHYPEGELIAFLQADKPYSAGTPNIDARTQQAILAAVEQPDYSRVKIPALAIYAFADPGKPLPPWYDADDEQLLANLAETRRLTGIMKRANIDAFRRGVERGQVLEMPKAEHYIIQSNLPEVREAIEAFSARIDPK